MSGKKMIVDDVILQTMVQSLQSYPQLENVNEELLSDICLEACEQGKAQDFAWLQAKVMELTGIDLGSEPRDPNEVEPESQKQDPLAAIEVSEPSQVETREDMEEVLRLHEMWMNSVLDPRKAIGGGRANLRGADLSGMNLVGVNLSCADLREANLTGVVLRDAILNQARLNDACLVGADLRGARLRRAHLEGANLEEAELEGCDLTETLLDKNSLDPEKAESTKPSAPTKPTEPQLHQDPIPQL